MRLRLSATPALILCAALALSGCKSADERAEEHFQAGMALIAAGDDERALVEFRNVFQLNGFHKEARATYAAILVDRGELREAYGQYLRLVEQYPDTFEARRDLALMALLSGNWDEIDRHGREAIRLMPEDATSRALAAALDYRAAAIAGDDAARDTAAAAAALLLDSLPAPEAVPEATPETTAEAPAEGEAGTATAPLRLPDAAGVLRRVLIDWRLASEDTEGTLPLLDASIAAEPQMIEFQMLKLRILAQQNDVSGTGALLQQMIQRFPDNDEVKTALIGWYMSQRDIDGAEAFLRAEAGEPTAAAEGHSAVIQLLQAARGPEAARAEIERLLAANQGTPNADLYGAMLASLDFDAGKRDEAVAAMEAILTGAEPSDQTRRLKIAQAQMLGATGNSVGARARIEEVLAEDPTQIEALKMRAAWRIQADDPGGAIVDLRAALDQAPRDSGILTLMAEAHERDGDMALATERLAMAVEVSNRGVEESLRYAQVLMRDGRTQAAETVLTDALAAHPQDLRMGLALADLYLSQQNWPQAQAMAATLRAMPDPQAEAAARQIDAALLLGQDRVDQGLQILSDQAEASGTAQSVAAVVDTMARAGRTDEARSYLDAQMAERPDDRGLVMLSAGLDALMGDPAKAEAQYRTLIAADPAAEGPVRLLYGLLMAADRRDEAVALVDTALQSQPKSGQLRWLQAGHLEAAGDIDGAIAVYEGLYAEDSSNVIVANNLASLITTFRDDQASLDRAWAVARRLRGSTEPALADTYGWIAFRRGELDAALEHLEPAAAGLPDNALVQYHLAMTYEALGRTEDAKTQFQRAIDVAGVDSTIPQIADARARLAALEAGGAAPATP